MITLESFLSRSTDESLFEKEAWREMLANYFSRSLFFFILKLMKCHHQQVNAVVHKCLRGHKCSCGKHEGSKQAQLQVSQTWFNLSSTAQLFLKASFLYCIRFSQCQKCSSITINPNIWMSTNLSQITSKLPIVLDLASLLLL